MMIFFNSKKGFNVRSFGSGSHCKLPGPAPNQPNVYDFATTYEEMYQDLMHKDPNLYPLRVLKRINVSWCPAGTVTSLVICGRIFQLSAAREDYDVGGVSALCFCVNNSATRRLVALLCAARETRVAARVAALFQFCSCFCGNGAYPIYDAAILAAK